MSTLEIISIVSTFIGVACFSAVFTILYQSYGKSSVTNTESGKRDIELIDTTLSEKSAKYKRRKSVLAVVKTVFFTLFLIIIIPVFALSLIERFSGGKPVLGKSFMVVATGSMSEKNDANNYLVANDLNDQFGQYSIIIIEKVNSPEDLKKYDVISYRNDKGVNIIHRIVEVTGSGESARYTTRGDANNDFDRYRPSYSDVIGVYRGKHVEAVGIVVMFLQSYSGIITVVALIYCLVMIDVVYRKIEKCEESRLKLLLDAIGSDENSAKSMRAEFKETIYYRGFAYRFDEKGFIDKTPIPEGEEPEEDTMVKVYDDGTPSQKITIETRKNDGKDS